VLTDRVNSVHWDWLVYLEMFLAGVAAGAYLVAVLLEWQGRGRSSTARVAHLVPFPLMVASGILLILDLNQPPRFWHMILMSEWLLPIMKIWSPMSYGSWLVLLFSGFAFASFLDALMARRVLTFGRWWRYDRTLHGTPLGQVWSLLGGLTALGVGLYSGALLTVSNFPGWGQTALIPALYIATALITGVAAVILIQALAGRIDADVLALARANTLMIAWWLIVMATFLLTLMGGGAPYILSNLPLLAIVAAILLAGVIPLGMHLGGRMGGTLRGPLAVRAALVLVGGFLVRYAIVMGPQYHVQP
jgi:formate-dependent nitrite reductase membrane component NrfD